MIHPMAFYALAAVIIGSSLLVVTVRNIFHAGLSLIGSFLGVAAIYASLGNYFLAAAQLLIYSGAIAVLILFGIMMTQQHWTKAAPVHNSLVFIALPLVLSLLLILAGAYFVVPHPSMGPGTAGILQGIGAALLQEYLLPFEIISLVLLAALIGAVAIAKDKEEA